MLSYLLKISTLLTIVLIKEIDSHYSDLTYFLGNENDTYSEGLIFKTVNGNNIKFYLYNRKKTNGHLLKKNCRSVRQSGFDKYKQTKILIHGYAGDYMSESIQLAKDAYISVGEYNVIAVDWSEYAFPYAVAINAAQDVGYYVGDMVSYLYREFGLKISNLHIIGHSLGAHIAGFSGHYVKKSVKVGRITGLDPAAPTFSDSPPSERLDWQDAQFVDVIHTSIRFLGMTKDIGHADFYPSGGQQQPGCPTHLLEKVTGHCDHSQAYIYFAESIRNKFSFPATKCKNVKEAIENRCEGKAGHYMGEGAVDRSPKGIYYVLVNQRDSFL